MATGNLRIRCLPFDQSQSISHGISQNTLILTASFNATKPINGYHPHPPSSFVIITQPESWYSFCCHMEGGRLSRPWYCRKGAQPVPKAVHRSGCHDKHNWPRPLTLQSIMPSLNHCDLPRHVGVNNLPKVVTRQRRGWELNSQPASCKSNALATRLPSHHVSLLYVCLSTLCWHRMSPLSESIVEDDADRQSAFVPICLFSCLTVWLFWVQRVRVYYLIFLLLFSYVII